MPRATTRIPGFLLDHAAPPGVTTLTDFYREEFIKHHQCLQAQREYFSAQAIQNAENALLKIIADLDRLTEEANAEQVVAQLLREFDVVTGLSGWSDPCKVN
jgi:type VI protein secretion system component VasF